MSINNTSALKLQAFAKVLEMRMVVTGYSHSNVGQSHLWRGRGADYRDVATPSQNLGQSLRKQRTAHDKHPV